MAPTQKKVGKDYYVFTKGNPTKCVIDSHGLRPPTKSYFRVPTGVTVYFYVHPHAFLMAGEESNNFGGKTPVNYVDAVHQIIKGEVTETEAFGPGQQCPDYLLSVRNREGRLAYLSTAADLLVKDGFQHIHCCFCRGGVWDGVKDMLGWGSRNESAGGSRYTG